MIWFTSDTHLGHERALEFTNRPWNKIDEMNRMQGLYRYDVGVDANGYSPISMEEILAWFDGVECRGRVKWKDWVDETGDKRVRRKLTGL